MIEFDISNRAPVIDCTIQTFIRKVASYQELEHELALLLIISYRRPELNVPRYLAVTEGLTNLMANIHRWLKQSDVGGTVRQFYLKDVLGVSKNLSAFPRLPQDWLGVPLSIRHCEDGTMKVVVYDNSIREWFIAKLGLVSKEETLSGNMRKKLARYGKEPRVLSSNEKVLLSCLRKREELLVDMPREFSIIDWKTTDPDEGVLFMDMDGVVANWRDYVIDEHFPLHNIRWLNKSEDKGKHLSEVYRKEPDLFYNLSPLPGAADFIRAVKESLPNGWKMIWLTSIDPWHHAPSIASADKKRWLKEHIYGHGSDVRDFVLSTIHSDYKIDIIHNYAKRGLKTILIDDFDMTCHKVNQLGGPMAIQHCFKNPHRTVAKLNMVLESL